MSIRRRPHHVFALLSMVLACLAIPAHGLAGPIVQDVYDEARNVAPWAGQTFTAEDALIGIVGVYVVDFTMASVATDPSLTYDLYEGTGTAGTLLGSRTFSGLMDGFSGFADVSFAGIGLVVGNTYTLLVSNDTLEWGVESAFITGGTYYTGGAAWLPPSGDPGTPPRDLRFHVLPDAIPEPASLLLLSAGLVATAVRRVTRRRR